MTAAMLAEAVEFLQTEFLQTPPVGIVLGSGLGGLANQIEEQQTVPYDTIPHFPRSTATGHRGQLVGGQLGGQTVVAMQGRFHFYEGYGADQITLPIRVMHALGAQLLVLSNASGGLNPRYASGDIMLIEDHLDWMWFRVADMASACCGRRANARPVYDPELIERVTAFARSEGIVVHRGVYAGLKGPNYETRAEYRFLRTVGADVAGMSTIPEAVVAHGLGMRILAFSTVTNVANPDALSETSGEEVVSLAAQAEPKLTKLVMKVLGADNL